MHRNFRNPQIESGVKLSFKQLWLQDQYQKIRMCIGTDEISDKDLQQFLMEVYETRYLSNGRLFNNTTNELKIMNQETFINKFLQEPLILSGYATLFKEHADAENISADALNDLLVSRKKNKKKMTDAEYGSDTYTYYKVMQLTFKLLANSYYGILGEKNSAFYNPLVQNSITMTGQDLITTSIISMESFLGNNFPFDDMDDVIEYIRNICYEPRTSKILDYVKPKTREDIRNYLYNKFRYPSEKCDLNMLDSYLEKLGPESLTRIYFKNQIQEICNEEWFESRLKRILDAKFEAIESEKELDDGIKDLFKEWKDKIIEFCYYDNIFEDRYKRAVKDYRDVICTIDTDLIFGSAA